MKRTILFITLSFLSSCYRYQGYVRDYQTRLPISNVFVGLSDSSSYSLTDSSGFFKIKTVRTLGLVFIKNETYRTRYFFSHGFARGNRIKWYQKDIYLVKAGYSGYVLDSTRKPLSEVDVYAIKDTDSLHQLTDENGYFNFEDCNEFVFSISFKKAGYVSTNVSCHFLPPRQILFKGDTIYLEQMND